MAEELKLGHIKPVGADNIVVDGKYVKGGFVVVANTEERNALKGSNGENIVNGSLCYCTADSKFYQYNGSSNTWQEVVKFTYCNPGKSIIEIQGHLNINEDGGHVDKPTNQTGLTSVNYAEYFNTGITMFGTNADGSGQWYNLSFPGKTGTLSTIKYKHNIALSGLFSGGPGGSAYCTFSFINDSSAAIPNLSVLNTALAANFSSKICPACGLFGYNSSGAELKLVTGVTYDYGGTCIYYMSIASTTSTSTMTINDVSSAEATIHPYPINSATITDTVEEC